MPRLFVLALCTAGVVTLSPPADAGTRRRVRTEDLLSITTPTPDGVTSAHPWINIAVRLGMTSEGVAADPATFRARLGQCNVTSLFEDIVEGGEPHKRARLAPELHRRCGVKLGGERTSRLKLKVKAMGDTRRRPGDVDRLRFGVVESVNQAPVPQFTASPGVIGFDCPGLGASSMAPPVVGAETTAVRVTFSASPSQDPDGDWLTYDWDFGDGATGSGETVTHDYTTTDSVSVTLRVTDGTPGDGGLEAMAVRVIEGTLSPDPGRSPGVVVLTAPPDTTLGFGTVDVGAAAEQTFSVSNTDPNPTSQVKFTVRVIDDTSDPAAFTVTDCPPETPCGVDGSGATPVTVRFSPQTAGHAQAVIEISSAARNRCLVHLVAHGYGGAGAGVPWGTDATVFGLSDHLFAVRPDGARVDIDTGVGICDGGALGGAPCVTDADCPGAGCGARSCTGGSAHGAPCQGLSDCPSGGCGQPFDALDICADGTGAVFLLNDDVHDDPDPNCDPCRTGTILRAGVDGERSVVTQSVTETSPALACDRSAAGRVFWTDYDLFGVDFDEREQLKSLRKNSGSLLVHVQNVSRRLGDVDPVHYIDPFDGYVFYEPTIALRVSADGNQRYVANFFGIYRLDPSPLYVTPDVDEVFSVTPNGLLLFAAASEPSSEVKVYKVDPDRAAHGVLRLTGLTPWASVRIANNGTSCDATSCRRSIFVNGIAGDQAGVVFVNVITRDGAVGGEPEVVPRNLRPRGTLRFEPRDNDAFGVATGFVDLDVLDRLDL
jgi:hypothetical protein